MTFKQHTKNILWGSVIVVLAVLLSCYALNYFQSDEVTVPVRTKDVFKNIPISPAAEHIPQPSDTTHNLVLDMPSDSL